MADFILLLAVRGGNDAKTRCSGALPAGTGQALALAMLEDMLEAARPVREITRRVVVTPTDAIAAGAALLGAEVLVDPPGSGLNGAYSHAIACLTADRPAALILMPGDLPEVTTLDLSLLIGACGTPHDVVISPSASDEGTSALVFHSEMMVTPSFGRGSLARHLAQAVACGANIRQVSSPTLAHDVDRFEDLRRLGQRRHSLATQCVLAGLFGEKGLPRLESAPYRNVMHHDCAAS